LHFYSAAESAFFFLFFSTKEGERGERQKRRREDGMAAQIFQKPWLVLWLF
jgi:hypothetical protein